MKFIKLSEYPEGEEILINITDIHSMGVGNTAGEQYTYLHYTTRGIKVFETPDQILELIRKIT